MATPFVQGRLRGEAVSFEISTECAHCAQPMQLTVDSNLRYQVHNETAQPLVFEPNVDWATFTEPNIIRAF